MTNLKMVRAGMLHSYDKEDPTLVVRWDVTGHCPYKCSYCYERESPKRKMEPSLEDLINAMPKLKQIVPAHKKLQFYLFGGEPTAHRDFLPFVTKLRESFPDAEISCLSNLFHNLNFLQQLYSIDQNFLYNVSVHFEYFSEDVFWEKISFLAQQKKKGTIFLQFLPAAREQVRAFAQRIRDTYPDFQLRIQFLRSRESNFRKHLVEYTEEDYAWGQQFSQQQEVPVYFIDYIDESCPGKIFRRKFNFIDAFHSGLSNFKGAYCVFSMQRLTIMLDGNLQTNFCLPSSGENIYKDASWPRTAAALLEPAVCVKNHCACRGMRDAAKWFEPQFAPLYFGGDKALAHDVVEYEELSLPE